MPPTPDRDARRARVARKTLATGRVKGTRYTITPAGRAALVRWLESEPGHTRLAFEAEDVIRVFFGEHGSVEDLRRTPACLRDQATADRSELATVAAAIEARAIPGRRSVNALSIRLVCDLQDTVRDWAQWALAETEDWTDPRQPWPGAEEVFADVMGAGA